MTLRYFILCTVCGQPVDLDEAHMFHDADCDRGGVCTCDGVAHPACCPECGEVGA